MLLGGGGGGGAGGVCVCGNTHTLAQGCCRESATSLAAEVLLGGGGGGGVCVCVCVCVCVSGATLTPSPRDAAGSQPLVLVLW